MYMATAGLSKSFETQYKMERRNVKGSSKSGAQSPKSKWMRDAKWGFFTHYLAHMASRPTPILTAEQWNKKVNSFQVKQLGDQLSSLKAPYCFVTVGQAGNCFCSPNKTFDKLFGPNVGSRTERDLIADIAAELIPRGIRMCVYCPAYGAKGSASKEQENWQEVITEWSERWGKSISAWWVDGGAEVSYPVYRAYFDAFKAGNKDALVATKLSAKLPPDQVLEDYVGGESGFPGMSR